MPREPLRLSDVQRDRAVGALLGTAVGEALGGGYKLRPVIPAEEPVAMIGRDPFTAGEWSEATAMAVAIAEIAAHGMSLRGEKSLDAIVQRWAWWVRNAKEVGAQTGAVLSGIPGDVLGAATAREAAAALHLGGGRILDGSCLTRAVPAALTNLRPYDDRVAGVTARELGELTHGGPDAGEGCHLWAVAIRHAILTGRLDARVGLRSIDSDRHEVWESRIAEAENSQPAHFATPEADVVSVLQGAWSAIVTTRIPDDDPPAGVFAADHFRLALEAAVRGGGNTDTVAAVAGGLLGAGYGASAIPAPWRLVLKGWPGLNTHTVVDLAARILNDGEPDRFDHTYGSWQKRTAPQRHPHDDGLWIGAASSLDRLPAGIDAVVSLCQVAEGHIPARARHLDVRLIDQVGANANLDFVLLDTVREIEQLRSEGATVFLHSWAAHSRTPAVAALYGARRAAIGVDQALDEVCAVLPGADPNRELRAATRRLHRTFKGENR